MKSLPLDQYIKIKYSGNKSEFAREFGLMPQNVNKLLNDRHFVIDGVLYRKSKYQQGE